MKIRLCLSASVAIGIALDVTGQPTWHNLEEGKYTVGFRLFQERDKTRTLGGRAGRAEQPRLVRIYSWIRP